jgi:DNA-binding NarL/FixJ family response regulator
MGSIVETLRDRTMTTQTRVLVVDEHRTFGDLIEIAFASETDLECIGTATTVARAQTMVAALHPDVVVMDVHLGHGDGIASTAVLTAGDPCLRVVVLTAFVDPVLMRRAAAAGASALLPKDGSMADLLAAVRGARRGRFLVHPRLVADAARRRPPAPRQPELTPRELEVLQMLGAGAGAHLIARELGISLTTCRGHVKNVLGKLGAHSQLEAVVIALQHQMIRVGATDST